MPFRYSFLGLIALALLLLSNSANPPNGKTGAPGDGLCTECHSPASATLDGKISVSGFPEAIVPNQTYQLTVTNTNTVGSGVKGGFQMTILGPLNIKAGEMSNPSASSVVTNAAGRQYFEHNPALNFNGSPSVSWTVDWTAPDMPDGSVVTWYAAGNIANGDFNSTGDKVVAANGSGTYMLSATREADRIAPLAIYPNPGTDRIRLEASGDAAFNSNVSVVAMDGTIVLREDMTDGTLDVSTLPSGMYVIRVQAGDAISQGRWVKL